MFEGTQLHPYLLVFLVAIVVNSVVQFFSMRKFTAMKAGGDALGFAPHLAVYYRSLGKYGPFPSTPEDSMYSSINSWLLSSLIAALLCVLIVLIADIFLYVAEIRYS